jgi:hypothetical protein
MSGALKHFFDTVYYPTLQAQDGLPYGYWVHGNSDVEGARRAVESIAGGLGWRLSAAPLLVTGAVDAAVRDAAFELGATVAAGSRRVRRVRRGRARRGCALDSAPTDIL